MRNITIDINIDDYTQMAQETDPIDLIEAVGYLSTWGLRSDRYNTVRIFMDWHSKTDLIAIYSDSENPDNKFTMGAIWRKDDGKFTFHS